MTMMLIGNTLTFSLLIGLLSSLVNGATETCKIVGFRVVLPTGVPECEEWGLFRDVVSPLADGFLVCREMAYGRNIEALTTGNCTMARLSFNLFRPDGTNQSRVERNPPFYLYGDDQKGTILSGNFNQMLGIHRLTVFPVGFRRLARNIAFNVVDCANFSPPNECENCVSSTEVCEGSLCVNKGYIRVTLTTFGYDLYDEGITITTPKPNGIFGSKFDMNANASSLPSFDPAGSGGYVETDFKYDGSCRSQGVWTKNIIFPSSSMAPKGIYKIDLSTVPACFDELSGFQTSLPATKQQFVLKVFINEVLQAQYTEKDGSSFTFTNK